MWIEEVNGKFKYVERYTDPVTGKDKKVSITLNDKKKKTQQEAMLFLNEKINKRVEPNVNSQAISFREVADDWLKYFEPTVKKSTYVRTTSNIKALNERVGDILFDKLTASHFNSFFLENLQSKRYKYNSMRQTRSVVRRIIHYALKYKGIDMTSIIPLLEVPKINVTVKDDLKYLEKEELQKVLNYLEVNELYQYKRMVILQVGTGMRFGELTVLDYETDINFENKSITVNKTYDSDNRIVTTTKTGKDRTIYFNETIEKVLKEQIHTTKLQTVANGHDRSNKLLFKTVHGTPFRTQSLNLVLSRIEIPNKKVTTHIFRHTFITMAVQNNISKDLIAQQVGHSDTNMIDKVYAHFTKEMEEQQKEAMLDFKII